MKKNEIKEIFLSNVIFDNFSKATWERFFEENDGFTLENVNEMYGNWIHSDAGRRACAEIRKKMSDAEDVLIQRGLTSIERGNYSILMNTHRLWTYVVKDNETNLYGLVTEKNDEIFPCIFSDINVSLTWFIDVKFKQSRFSFSFTPQGFVDKLKTWYEKGEFSDRLKRNFIYYLNGTIKTYESDCRDDDSTVKKLFELLNVKHKLEFTD